MELLEVTNLQTHFILRQGILRAVDGVSFSLRQGEALGLVGESGCGKTTTALSLMRLLPENGRIVKGQVLYRGEDIVKKSREEIRQLRWKDISIIFQGAMNALNPVVTIGDQIKEAILLHEPVTEQDALRRVKRLFELVEIEGRRIGSYPHEFSGGMRQRAMIAMALACNPKIVIGDEPTTALDVMIQAQIFELIERLRKEFRMAMILITHDLSVLGDTCDSAAVMYAGKIVEYGTIEELFRDARHPYTERLLRSFPNVGGSREMVASIPGAPPNLIDPPSGCRFHPRCELATERCRELEPPVTYIGPTHWTACHERGNKNG